jgi:hypothetical protein
MLKTLPQFVAHVCHFEAILGYCFHLGYCVELDIIEQDFVKPKALAQFGTDVYHFEAILGYRFHCLLDAGSNDQASLLGENGVTYHSGFECWFHRWACMKKLWHWGLVYLGTQSWRVGVRMVMEEIISSESIFKTRQTEQRKTIDSHSQTP